jgi:hypothetical protein
VRTLTPVASARRATKACSARSNERIEGLRRDDAWLEFVCECTLMDCASFIRMNVDDYGRLRGEPAQFVVSHGHVVNDVERVVAERPGYTIVEKIGVAATTAAALDPRAVA